MLYNVCTLRGEDYHVSDDSDDSDHEDDEDPTSANATLQAFVNYVTTDANATDPTGANAALQAFVNYVTNL